ncbi:hypothetical protein ES703_78320 [subsurface metagenome]
MEKTWKPTTAGILTIIAGCVGIGAGVLIALFGGLMGLGSAIAGGLGEPVIGGLLGGLGGIIGMIGAGIIGLGVVAIIGGVFALRRKLWRLALAGAICAIPCSSVLGILATIFVSLGRREFTQS